MSESHFVSLDRLGKKDKLRIHEVKKEENYTQLQTKKFQKYGYEPNFQRILWRSINYELHSTETKIVEYSRDFVCVRQFQ